MNIAHDPMPCNMSNLISHVVLGLPMGLEATFCTFSASLALGTDSWAYESARCNNFLGTAMDTDVRALRSLAQTYFDAAYEMDADKFASIFHPSSSVTKVGDDGNVGMTPIAMWLTAVRNMKAPQQQGLERHDQIVSIDVERELALLKLKLQIPPRYFTDMLSCLKVNGTWKIVQKVMTSKT
jgi:putative lumazine-binding protein